MPSDKLLKDLADADAVRMKAYANDLLRGLKIVRTFSQGVTVFGSARLPQDDKYCKKARELGQLLAQNGHTVVTGGGPGIMEAANHGAFEYGGRSIGLNITLRHEQFPNPYLTDMVQFQYFFARKVMLAMASKVFVMFPGGIGTLDELSEVILLMQESKMPKMPVFLFGKTYWKPLEKFIENKMLPMGMVSKSDLKIFKITDEINDIVKAANRLGHPKINESFYDGFSSAVGVQKLKDDDIIIK